MLAINKYPLNRKTYKIFVTFNIQIKSRAAPYNLEILLHMKSQNSCQIVILYKCWPYVFL